MKQELDRELICFHKFWRTVIEKKSIWNKFDILMITILRVIFDG